MIAINTLFELFKKHNINFFTGVPDSILKPFCDCFRTVQGIQNITAANEGNAVAIACGYYLATSNIPCIYLQNSGIGNIINPLLSLTDQKIYNTPALYFIGWRGEPDVSDEPQHITQGRLTEPLMKTLEMDYQIISAETTISIISETLEKVLFNMRETSKPFAFVVSKDAFSKIDDADDIKKENTITRRQSIDCIIENIPKEAVVVCSTGKASRELYEIRQARNESHERDFLTVGSMGHSSQIALAISLNKKTRVYCIEGEGSLMMHMGSMVVNGQMAEGNFIHIVINNGVHDSVGGQINFGKNIDFSKIAQACGYLNTFNISTIEELASVTKADYIGSVFVQVNVSTDISDNLSRPKTSPNESKQMFVNYLKTLR